MKFSKLTISILTLSLVTILSYLGYQIYLQTKKVDFSTIDPKYTTPLNPNLDPKLINELENRGQ